MFQYNIEINKFFIKLFSILFCVFIVTAIIVQRGLYADGVFFLLYNINQVGSLDWPIYNDEKHIRLFIDFLNQLLPSTAVYFKINSFQFVSYLFNINLFMMPLLMASIVYYISKVINKTYLIYSIFSGFVYFVFGSYIFILNQAITFSFVLWGILLYTFMEREPAWLDWLLISLLLVLTFRGHEMILTVFPVILLSACWSFNKNPQALKYFKGLIALITTCAFFFAIYWQLSHPVSTQTADFIGTLLQFLQLGVLFDSVLSIPIIGILVSFWLVTIDYFKLDKSKIDFILWVYFLFSASIIVRKSFFDIPDIYIEYSYRVFIAFGLPVLMLLTTLYTKLKLNFLSTETLIYLIRVTLISAIFMTLWQIEHNYHWNGFINSIEKNIKSSDSIEIDSNFFQAPLNKYAKRYEWNWCWPGYSILVQKGIVAKIIRPSLPYIGYYDINRKDQKIRLPFELFENNYYFDFTVLTTAAKKNEREKNYYYNWKNQNLTHAIGFSQQLEHGFRWTDANEASLTISPFTVPKKGVTLTVRGWAFVSDQHKEQVVHIYINNIKLITKKFQFDKNDQIEHDLVLNIENRFVPSNTLNVRFIFDDLVSPKQLNLSNDDRMLGMAISGVNISIE